MSPTAFHLSNREMTRDKNFATRLIWSRSCALYNCSLCASYIFVFRCDFLPVNFRRNGRMGKRHAFERKQLNLVKKSFIPARRWWQRIRLPLISLSMWWKIKSYFVVVFLSPLIFFLSNRENDRRQKLDAEKVLALRSLRSSSGPNAQWNEIPKVAQSAQ